MKRIPIESRVFKKYTASTFAELEIFACIFQFQIVDRYWTYDADHGKHIPAIEVH